MAITLLALVLAEDSVSRKNKYDAVVSALRHLPDSVRKVRLLFPACQISLYSKSNAVRACCAVPRCHSCSAMAPCPAMFLSCDPNQQC